VLGGGGWKFKASPGNGQRDPIYKITRSKWTGGGGVAQSVEHLLSKKEALSSKSSPTKKKKRKREMQLKQW
jgi:hypothetical protein